MKILITGVNGFIGQHLAAELLKRKHTVIGLGRDADCAVSNISKYYSGSVLDKKIVTKAASDIDAIVHLAALTAHADIIDNRFEALEINLEGTKNVLNAFAKSETAKIFLYSSTGKVYGKIQTLPITEDHLTTPLNILGKSKLITEKLIDFYNDDKKSFIIFRVFNMYGPHQKKNFLIPTILKQLKSKEITLGDVDAKRDYVYITDLINAFVLALEKKKSPGVSVYNICTGIGTSAMEIVKLFGKLSGREFKIKTNSALIRTDEMNEEYGSYAKAQKDLGWKPKVALKNGLQQILKI